MNRGWAGSLLLLLQLSAVSCSAAGRRPTGLVGGVCAKLRLEATLKAGLINQHLSLLSFVSIGVACGADELLVTAASSRETFTSGASWFESDFNRLWNASALTTFLQGHGVRFLVGEQGDDDAALRLDGLHFYPPHRDFSDICVRLRQHVAPQLARREAALEQSEDVPTVQVSVTGLLHSTLSQRSQLHTDVARAVRFSDHLQLLADKAAARMLQRTGARAFNAAHLRVEEDFYVTDAARPALLRSYAKAFKQAGLAAELPLYLASAVFETRPQLAVNWRHNFSSLNVHKEVLLDAPELTPLLSEEKGALDFLVAVQAERFVGMWFSSFSFWVAEARKLAGLAPELSFLISSPGSEVPESAFTRANGLLLPS